MSQDAGSSTSSVPEAGRQSIDLPSTSPFLRWNEISLPCGFNPGYVAIGSDLRPATEENEC